MHIINYDSRFVLLKLIPQACMKTIFSLIWLKGGVKADGNKWAMMNDTLYLTGLTKGFSCLNTKGKQHWTKTHPYGENLYEEQLVPVQNLVSVKILPTLF